MTLQTLTHHQLVEIAWLHGCLDYKLRPEQQVLKDILDRSGRELVVPNIARKIGKTTTCSTFAIEQAIQKKQHIRYATAFLTDLQEFLLPIFDLILADCPDDLRPKYLASKKEFHFTNGSVIKLVGLDKNKNGLRGNIIDILIVDEAAFVSNLEYLYKSVIIPATKNRPFKLIFPSTPPESPEHFWARELINKAKERNTYIEMTLDADEALDPQERKRLLDEVGGELSSTAQREYFCKIIVDATRAVSPNFDPKRHVSDHEPDHVRWMIFGDTGAKDKTVFLKVGFDHSTRLIHFRDELVAPQGTTTSEIVRLYKAKFGTDMPLVLDCAEQLRIDYAGLGLSAGPPIKDDFGAGILLLDNTWFSNKALIHPDCKLLIRTLEAGLLNKTRTDYERSESLGHCDAVAAAIYALRGVDKLTDLRPRPKNTIGTLAPKPAHPLTKLLG